MDEIAWDQGVSVDEVCRVMRQIELASGERNTTPLNERVSNCREGGLTWGEIAELLDITPDEARQAARKLRRMPGRSGRSKIPLDVAGILERRTRGEEWRQIAQSLGVSIKTLHNRVNEIRGARQ